MFYVNSRNRFMQMFNYCFPAARWRLLLIYKFVEYLSNNSDNESWKSFQKIGCNLSYDSEPEWHFRIIDFNSLSTKYIFFRQIVDSAEASGTEKGRVSFLKTDAKCWLELLAIFHDP